MQLNVLTHINEPFCSRMYALRRIKDAFRDNKSLTDESKLNQYIAEGKENLEMLRRQVLISQLYKTDKLIIEK